MSRPHDSGGMDDLFRRLGAFDAAALGRIVTLPWDKLDDPWTEETARRLGVQYTLRSRGRPRTAESFVMSPFPVFGRAAWICPQSSLEDAV